MNELINFIIAQQQRHDRLSLSSSPSLSSNAIAYVLATNDNRLYLFKHNGKVIQKSLALYPFNIGGGNGGGGGGGGGRNSTSVQLLTRSAISALLRSMMMTNRGQSENRIQRLSSNDNDDENDEDDEIENEEQQQEQQSNPRIIDSNSDGHHHSSPSLPVIKITMDRFNSLLITHCHRPCQRIRGGGGGIDERQYRFVDNIDIDNDVENDEGQGRGRGRLYRHRLRRRFRNFYRFDNTNEHHPHTTQPQPSRSTITTSPQIYLQGPTTVVFGDYYVECHNDHQSSCQCNCDYCRLSAQFAGAPACATFTLSDGDHVLFGGGGGGVGGSDNDVPVAGNNSSTSNNITSVTHYVQLCGGDTHRIYIYPNDLRTNSVRIQCRSPSDAAKLENILNCLKRIQLHCTTCDDVSQRYQVYRL